MIKTNKDVLFILIVVLWLASDIYALFDDFIDMFFINNLFVVILCVIILFKIWNEKFRNWLNKNLYE